MKEGQREAGKEIRPEDVSQYTYTTTPRTHSRNQDDSRKFRLNGVWEYDLHPYPQTPLPQSTPNIYHSAST